MKSSLMQGKKVLMFSPFGSCKHYTDHIYEELRARGAEVHLYDERPSQSHWAKIYMYLFRRYVPIYFHNYVKKIAEVNKTFNPDVIFVIRGQGFDEKILTFLKNHFKKAKFILYQWDPLRAKRIKDILDLYDNAFSFDKQDTKVNPEFTFRPSFYIPEYLPCKDCEKERIIYDMCFVGTLYNNRWTTIKTFKEYLDAEKLKYCLYLYVAGWPRYLWEFIFKGILLNPKEVHFSPMNYTENIRLVKKSKCVLDIVFAEQTGLSMRAYESMAAHRKYITTNPEVQKYDFYNPNNILIVDIHKPNIPKEFLESEFEPLDDAILYKYSISGFVDDIFERS